MWTILLKDKGEAFEKFKSFKSIVEHETRLSIKTLRTDRGGEFTSIEFNKFCEKYGIQRHLTAPYTPQQNGVVERRNRTLMEMTRSILKHMNLPNYLWGEAVIHASYIINRVATRSLSSQTPYEVFKGRKPSVEHLRVFGCIGYVKVNKHHLRKLDDRSRSLVHLGTEPGSKAYRMFDPTNQRIVVSRDVTFDEDKSWRWSNKLDGKEEEPGEFQILFDTLGNQVIGTEENKGEITEEQDNEVHEDSSEVDEEPVLRRSTRESKKPAYLDDYVLLADDKAERLLLFLDEEPWSYEEAVEEKVWRDACQDEIESIIKK